MITEENLHNWEFNANISTNSEVNWARWNPVLLELIAEVRRLQEATKEPDVDGWWCSKCKKTLDGEHVTFYELHDERYGGCGNKVSYKYNPSR